MTPPRVLSIAAAFDVPAEDVAVVGELRHAGEAVWSLVARAASDQLPADGDLVAVERGVHLVHPACGCGCGLTRARCWRCGLPAGRVRDALAAGRVRDHCAWTPLATGAATARGECADVADAEA